MKLVWPVVATLALMACSAVGSKDPLVGVTVDAKGALLVADDVGGIVWRVTNSAQ